MIVSLLPLSLHVHPGQRLRCDFPLLLYDANPTLPHFEPGAVHGTQLAPRTSPLHVPPNRSSSEKSRVNTHINGYAFFFPTDEGVDRRGGITGACAMVPRCLCVRI